MKSLKRIVSLLFTIALVILWITTAMAESATNTDLEATETVTIMKEMRFSLYTYDGNKRNEVKSNGQISYSEKEILAVIRPQYNDNLKTKPRFYTGLVMAILLDISTVYLTGAISSRKMIFFVFQ